MNTDAMIGRKYGALTVISRERNPHWVPGTAVKVVVQCDCGNRAVSDARELRTGDVLRCGKCALMVPKKQDFEIVRMNRQIEKEAKRAEQQRKKQIAAENRMKLEAKREQRKQARIDRMNRQLAAAKSISGGNG